LPAPTDPQSDDPATDGLGVQLGVIHVTNSGGVASIDHYSTARRTYVGLRAQRIVCPVEPTDFHVLDKQTARNPATSLEIHPNVFAEKNLIVGHDFKVDFGTSTPAPEPPDSTYPSPRGNLKVEHDVFLQNELYTLRPTNTTPAWMSLGEYIKSLLPDIQTFTGAATTINLSSQSTDPAGGVPINLPPFSSRLRQIDPSRIKVIASITQIELQPPPLVAASTFMSLSVNGHGTADNTTTPPTCTVTLTFTGKPSKQTNPSPPTWTSQWGTISINCVVILYPL
jgi:hypothetical protein